MREILNKKAYTLVEIVITLALGAIITTGVTVSMLKFRDNVQYDILLNKIVESVQSTRLKAVSSKENNAGVRSSFSVHFFTDRIVEFEGSIYTEGAGTNIVSEVPVGLRLSSTCSPVNDGIVTFSVHEGANTNDCIIYIYRFEQTVPIGSIVIKRFGVEEAQ
jgi:prepilin-type N-terminal cleavage/methylation domain-containing protein